MFHQHDHNQCVDQAILTAESICTKRGSRLTDQRKHILRLIWESHKPVKAYELLEKLAKHTGKIQPPTVYRALDFLIDHGLIHRIDSQNAFVGCHHPDADHECFFLICRACGNADEYCSPELKNAITQTSDHHNFNVEGITLELSGICHICGDK